MKKGLSFLLAVGICLSLVSCQPKSTVPTETAHTSIAESSGNPVFIPTHSADWEHRFIDLSDNTHVPIAYRADGAAPKTDYTENTYEYDYMMALSGISFYAARANSLLNFLEFDATPMDTAFYKTVDKSAFTDPYREILYQAYLLLENRDFALFDLTTEICGNYLDSLPYTLDITENWDIKALSFSDMDTKITEYAESLLNLPLRYPDYTGEFKISAEGQTICKNLIAACQPVMKTREMLWEKFSSFYHDYVPKLTVTEKFDREHTALQVTLQCDSPLYLSGVPGEYIQDFRYQLVSGSSGKKSPLAEPMESPVILYIPIREYYQGEYQKLNIIKIGEQGQAFSETVTLKTKTEDCYSHAPIQMENEFLHKALTDFFGGSYSEYDLLCISSLRVDYAHKERFTMKRLPNRIAIYPYSGEAKDYLYTDFFPLQTMPDQLPECTERDMRHFHILSEVVLQQMAGIYAPEEAIQNRMKPYTVTQKTWG